MAEEQCAILEVTSEAVGVRGGKSDSDEESDSSITETNGLLQSPSGESISSFLDRTLELVLESSQDFVARVDNPQKVVEPWGTYVSFRIRTRCKRWDDEDKEYVVRRRYNDFKAFHERLVSRSLQVVPPLPGGHSFLAQLDRFSKDFVLQRMGLLNIFIKRLTSHSILSHSEDLKIFLTASNSEMGSHFKTKTSYLSSLTDSLYSLTSQNGAGAPQSNACRVRDPEFASIGEYMTGLRAKLDSFANISSRIAKEQAEIAAEMTSVRPLLESWSQVERFNRDTLKRHARSDADAKRGENLGEILKRMARPYYCCANAHAQMVAEFPYSLGNPIQEYLLYVDAVKAKLKEREAMQSNLEAAQDKLAKRAGSRDIDECHDRLQCASEALRSDIQGWQRQKKTDLKLLLLEMAKKQIDFHERSLASWESVVPASTSAAASRKTNSCSANGDAFLKQMAAALASIPTPTSEQSSEVNLEGLSKDSSEWEKIENDIQ